jgi:hypothetical protein
MAPHGAGRRESHARDRDRAADTLLGKIRHDKPAAEADANGARPSRASARESAMTYG